MRIGTSIVVMAIGAIMAFAVEVDRAEGFNINTAGIILMILGAIGLIATLAMDAPRAPPHRRRRPGGPHRLPRHRLSDRSHARRGRLAGAGPFVALTGTWWPGWVSAGTRPRRPALKSSYACWSSARVFITNGP